MPLGTLDRNPPPFFHQGPSARSRLLLCAALAVFLMAADQRFALIQPLRNALATVLRPVVMVLRLPFDGGDAAGTYLAGLEAARARQADLERQLAAQAEQAARAERLAQENTRLRALLDLRPAVPVHSQVAEVLYEAPDPYSHKLVIDRGSQQGVQPGSPVLNEQGLLGQVTRVYLMSAEVTLLADRDAVVPVVNARTLHRSAAFGSGDEGQMELRFVSANDDVQVGDLLQTSGIDGLYPAGVAVARVSQVDRRGSAGFARIALTPVARTGGLHHVLLLDPVGRRAAEANEAAARTAVAAAAVAAAASAAPVAASAASAPASGARP